MKTLTLCKIGGAWILIVSFVVVMSVLSLGAQQNPVTISIWDVWGGTRLPLVEKQIADFETLHPNIKIDHLLVSQNVMEEKYLTAIAGGEPPNVMMVFGSSLFPSLVEKQVLMCLDDYLKRDNMEGEKIFYKPDWKTYVYDGKCYGLPLVTGGGYYFLFYDKDQFREVGLDPAKPPTTWSELEEYAARLTAREGGKIKRVGFDVNGMTNFAFKEWLFLNDGKLITDDRKTVLFGSPEGLETLEWMVGFTDRLYGDYEPLLPFTDKLQASGRLQRGGFYAGKIAMHVDGVWYFAMVRANAPDKDYSVALMPYNDRNPKAKVRNVFEGGWCYCIPEGVDHPEETWEWLKYITVGKGAKDFFQAQLRPSAVIEFTEDPYYAENNPFWDVVLGCLEKSVRSPVLPVQPEINKISIQMTEEALLHKKTPEEALKWAVEQTQKIIDEYWATH